MQREVVHNANLPNSISRLKKDEVEVWTEIFGLPKQKIVAGMIQELYIIPHTQMPEAAYWTKDFRPHPLQCPLCPRCTQRMIPKMNRRDESLFFGCVLFPSCKGTKRMQDKNDVLSQPINKKSYKSTSDSKKASQDDA